MASIVSIYTTPTGWVLKLSCDCSEPIDRRTQLILGTQDFHNHMAAVARDHQCPPKFMGVPVVTDPKLSPYEIRWEPGPAVERITAQELRARQEEQRLRYMDLRNSMMRSFAPPLDEWARRQYLGTFDPRQPPEAPERVVQRAVGFSPAQAPVQTTTKKPEEKKEEWHKDRFELIELD